MLLFRERFRTGYSLDEGIEVRAALVQQGVYILSEGGEGVYCNPLTCALFLTCTHKHCSAELSVAQIHAALLCINSQHPYPHSL